MQNETGDKKCLNILKAEINKRKCGIRLNKIQKYVYVFELLNKIRDNTEIERV